MLPEGAFKGTTSEATLPYVVRYIVPCPPSLNVVLLHCPFSLHITKSVALNETRLDSDSENNNDKEGKQDGEEVNVFVANLHVVIHATCPNSIWVILRNDGVGECKSQTVHIF